MTKELSVRAPHVDAKWANEFVVALRLRGASGAAIGAALLEVESHLAEQGGDAATAFGDAGEYAAALQLPNTQRWTTSQIARLFMKITLGIVAVTLLLAGLIAVWRGELAQVALISIGVGLLVSVTAFALLTVRGGAALRYVAEHPVIGGILVVTGAAVISGGMLALAIPAPEPFVVAIPPAFAIGGAVVLAAALVAIAIAERRRGAVPDDSITFPPCRPEPAVTPRDTGNEADS